MPGYGVARFDKAHRTIPFECWPRYADPRDPSTGGQSEGWPVTVRQLDNYARAARAWLPRIEVEGIENPVIEVMAEKSGERIYALRIRGRQFHPRVFEPGRYTIRVGDPDAGVQREFRAVEAGASEERVLRARF